MADYKSIDEVFSDPFFAELLEKNVPKPKVVFDEDKLVFNEINEFIAQNGRLPQKTKLGKERTLFNRLESIKNNPKKYENLKELDKFNILPICESEPKIVKMTQNIEFKSLDDAFKELDKILDISELPNSLFDVSGLQKPKQKRIQPSDYAVTKRIENFAEFKGLFEKIHSEISAGLRKLAPIENSQDIKIGDIFILKGVMLYVSDKSEDFISQSGQKNAKLKVIYENGTFADLRLNSLAAGFRRSDSYRVLANNSPQNDIATGFIYVLKSLSKDERIANIKNLYKIGMTTKNNIKERIANAQNEPTYLYAPVELVAEYEVMNFNPAKLETALHHMFDNRLLQAEITLSNGKIVKPKEWFVIELDEIKKAIGNIVEKCYKIKA